VQQPDQDREIGALVVGWEEHRVFGHWGHWQADLGSDEGFLSLRTVVEAELRSTLTRF